MTDETNSLPSREWVESQLKDSNTHQSISTSVLRLWDVLADMRATPDEFDEILGLTGELVSAHALFIDPGSQDAKWHRRRDLVVRGKTVRVSGTAFAINSNRYRLNGQIGKVQRVSAGYATVEFTDSELGTQSVDTVMLDTKVN